MTAADVLLTARILEGPRVDPAGYVVVDAEVYRIAGIGESRFGQSVQILVAMERAPHADLLLSAEAGWYLKAWIARDLAPRRKQGNRPIILDDIIAVSNKP